jgi:5-methylcytosine-specific restriction endonuclease McrA
MLKDYLRRTRTVRFSKSNVYLRDSYVCAYCSNTVFKKTATIDHVLPISKGGKTSWDNIVTACMPCNSTKSNRTDIKPLYKPYKPGYYELVRKRRQLDMSIQHPSWEQWINV